MTIPLNNQAYTQATGTSTITAPIFQTRDPGVNDVNYKISQLWINIQTNAIWILQQLSTIGNTQDAQWRAIGPIVLNQVPPTSTDYLYPIGQSWVDLHSNEYWILVDVTDNVATWSNLSEGGGTGILSLSDGAGTKTFPTVGGNIQLANGNNITTTAGTNQISIAVTGTEQFNVQIGNSLGSLTSIPPSSGEGVPLISQGSMANPVFGTALVPGGGTGNVMFQPYVPICGGITATGPLQQAAMGFGNSGYVLTSTGIASLPTWQANPGSGSFSSIKNQVFTSSGTYTPTSGMVYCSIQCLGGGGGGGGGVSAPVNKFSASGPGGAGEYAVGIFNAASVGSSQSVIIGVGGSGTTGGTGGSGGNTSVGGLISAFGGLGGVVSPAMGPGSTLGAPGVGGTGGTGGDYRTPGAIGDHSVGSGAGTSTAFLCPCSGANSQLGSGGAGVIGNAQSATGYGAGGGAACTAANSAATTGGNGSSGIVIITEYIG